MQITLYHSPHSRSQRIIWLFEELGIDYQLIIVTKSNSQQHLQNIPSSALPLKFPTALITTPEQDLVLTESSAIAEFFSQYFQKLISTSKQIKAQSDYLFWKNYADASFMPNLALKQIFSQIVERTPLPFKWVSCSFKYAFNAGFLNQAIDQQLDRINSHLIDQHWLAGEKFTIADILLWFPLNACISAHSNIQQYPAVLRYVRQIQMRPAFQSALTQGQWNEAIFKNYWQKAW